MTIANVQIFAMRRTASPSSYESKAKKAGQVHVKQPVYRRGSDVSHAGTIVAVYSKTGSLHGKYKSKMQGLAGKGFVQGTRSVSP